MISTPMFMHKSFVSIVQNKMPFSPLRSPSSFENGSFKSKSKTTQSSFTIFHLLRAISSLFKAKAKAKSKFIQSSFSPHSVLIRNHSSLESNIKSVHKVYQPFISWQIHSATDWRVDHQECYSTFYCNVRCNKIFIVLHRILFIQFHNPLVI